MLGYCRFYNTRGKYEFYSTIHQFLLNGVTSTISFTFKTGGTLIAPTALGYMGSKMLGAGSHIGMMQGLSAGVYHVWAFLPGTRYIERHKRNKDCPLENPELLQCVLVVTEFVIPFLLNKYVGIPLIEKGLSNFHEKGFVRRVFESEKKISYGFMAFLAIQALPWCTQHFISYCRGAYKDADKKR